MGDAGAGLTRTPEPSVLASMPTLAADDVLLRPVADRDVESYAQAFHDDPDLGRRAGFDTDPTAEWVRSRLEGAAERRAKGVLREFALERGMPVDIVVYGLLCDDWLSRRRDLASV